MILTGPEIGTRVGLRHIIIEPFSAAALNPNSYDVALGDSILVYSSSILDVAKHNPVEELRIPPEGLLLKGGGFYLGHSVERIGSDHFVPILHAKSGTARAGLFVHVTANLIDLGSVGNLTFQLAPVLDVDSVGPRPSESYRAWLDETAMREPHGV